MSEQRAERMGHQLRREIDELIRELKGPRVQDATLITVTRVQVSGDLGVAKVYVSIIARDPVAVMRAIGRSQRYFQGQLLRRLRIRKVPELRFELDLSGDQ